MAQQTIVFREALVLPPPHVYIKACSVYNTTLWIQEMRVSLHNPKEPLLGIEQIPSRPLRKSF